MEGMTTERTEPSGVAGERAMLEGWLEYHRATLAVKCEGLSDAELRERSVPPSTLSLLGLVRHMAEVERAWFRRRLAGEDVPFLYCHVGEDGSWDDADFDEVDSAEVAEAFATWQAECDHARRIAAAADSLEIAGTNREGDPVSLRWILSHMVEEYARHNGHADLLRESIDGAVGD